MKVEFNITKTKLFVLILSLFIISGAIFAFAIGGTNPNVFGHSAGEIIGTLSCNSTQALTVNSSGNWNCVNLPQGQIGPQGPAGPTPSIEYVVKSEPYPAKTCTANCSAGKKIVGGSCDPSNKWYIKLSHPTSTNNGWYCLTGDNNVDGSVHTGPTVCYAICM